MRVRKRTRRMALRMFERPVIQGFMTQYPKLTNMFPRAVDTTIKAKNREPRQLAFFHAALEVEVNIQGKTRNIVDAYWSITPDPLRQLA